MGGVKISFNVDTTRLTEAINAYSAQVNNGKSRSDIVREQMRFALKRIIELTPFETLAKGRQSVHSDLRRAVKPYGGEDGSFSKINNVGLRNRLVSYLRGQNYDAIRDIFAKLSGRGFYASYTLKDFSPTLHHSAQNARGRVVQDGTIVTPQVAEWKRYLASLQSKVGRARGGWSAGASLTGLSLPGWVTRHSAGGSASEVTDPGKVTFTMTNRAILIPDYKEKVAVALAGRERAMAEDLRRWLNKEATHAGIGR